MVQLEFVVHLRDILHLKSTFFAFIMIKIDVIIIIILGHTVTVWIYKKKIMIEKRKKL